MWKYYAKNAEKFENKLSEAFKARSAAERKGLPAKDPFFAKNSEEIDFNCRSAATNFVKAIKAAPMELEFAKDVTELGMGLCAVLDTRAGFAKEQLDEAKKSKNTRQIANAKSLVKEAESFKDMMLESVGVKLSKMQAEYSRQEVNRLRDKVLQDISSVIQLDASDTQKVETNQSESLSKERDNEKDPIENIINSRSRGKNNDRGVSL